MIWSLPRDEKKRTNTKFYLSRSFTIISRTFYFFCPRHGRYQIDAFHCLWKLLFLSSFSLRDFFEKYHVLKFVFLFSYSMTFILKITFESKVIVVFLRSILYRNHHLEHHFFNIVQVHVISIIYRRWLLNICMFDWTNDFDFKDCSSIYIAGEEGNGERFFLFILFSSSSSSSQLCNIQCIEMISSTSFSFLSFSSFSCSFSLIAYYLPFFTCHLYSIVNRHRWHTFSFSHREKKKKLLIRFSTKLASFFSSLSLSLVRQWTTIWQTVISFRLMIE